MSSQNGESSESEDAMEVAVQTVLKTQIVRYIHITFWGLLLLSVTGWKTALVWYGVTVAAGLLRTAFEQVLGRDAMNPVIGDRVYPLVAALTSCAWATAPLLAALSGHPAGTAASLVMLAAGYLFVLVQFRASPTNVFIGSIPYNAVLAGLVLLHWGTPNFYVYLAGIPVLYGALFSAVMFGFLSHLSAQRAHNARIKAQEELVQAKEAAEKASLAKTQFLANTSHEIRTPLNGIMGMAQVMIEDQPNREDAEKLDIILDSGESLLAILNDVLDVSKVEAGATEVLIGRCEIPRLFSRLESLWQGRAREKQIAFSIDVDRNVPDALDIDEMHLRQCVNNLIGNALKFTRAGRVSVRVRYGVEVTQRGDLQIEVVDTGIGITASAMDKIFDAFTQDDASRTREFSGTGLGLTITQRLARLMGGDVSVASVEGEGATFTLTVAAPVSETPSEMSPKVNTQPEPRPDAQIEAGSDAACPGEAVDAADRNRPQHYLVADDNRINRTILRLVLEKRGHTVDEAENGEQAVEQVAACHYDAVFMDIHMPIMDGIDAIKAIRALETRAEVLIFAVTADAMKGDRERYMALGADGYISKPIKPETLESELGRASVARVAGLTASPKSA
jgi:signal transduction histidine kinase/ActR/RegA family two-component response regulator